MAHNVGKEFIPDDCEIIPETPPANMRKKYHRKKAKQITVNRNNYDEYLNSIFDQKCKIERTVRGCFDFNNPYVYHDIEEVLNYKENWLPRNNNIHIIGTLKFCKEKGHYLVGFSKKNKIILDFTLVLKLPSDSDIISVFGSVEFKRKSPMFVVKFFRQEVNAVVHKYIENLKILRNFIPTEYLSLCSNSL